MPFNIVKNNIASVSADAIVYADTPQPFSMFKFDPMLQFGKGKELQKTRQELGSLSIGDAKIVPASQLDAKYIIHTSGPAWHNGVYHEKKLLCSCYERTFELALEHQCKSIALSIIASDGLGYPKKMTEQIAFDCISKFLRTNDMLISIVIPEKAVFHRTIQPYSDVRKYIASHYVEGTTSNSPSLSPEKMQAFSEALSQWIEKKNLQEQDVCYNANMSNRIFQEILTGKAQDLTKNQAIALGIGLKLSLDEMQGFLKTAGYELTKHSKSDLIVEYYILKNNYDMQQINPMLVRFEQEVLGI